MKRKDSRLRLYPSVAKRIERLGRRGQVLEAMWSGKCTKEIAADLGVSPKTVEYHRAQLYRVFGVENPVSLCRRALAGGALRLDGGPHTKDAPDGGPPNAKDQRDGAPPVLMA